MMVRMLDEKCEMVNSIIKKLCFFSYLVKLRGRFTPYTLSATIEQINYNTHHVVR